jgi:hypothetical protein
MSVILLNWSMYDNDAEGFETICDLPANVTYRLAVIVQHFSSCQMQVSATETVVLLSRLDTSAQRQFC